MSPNDAFRAELASSAVRSSSPDELLPERLAQACTAALPFDGAGLSFSMLPDRRLPWGSSDPMAAAAERLQFALGEGPCATAHSERTAVFSTWEQLEARWPVYADQLAQHTPYRCALALPIGGPLAAVGVLTLYRTRSGPLADGVLDAVQGVADQVGDTLVDGLGASGDLMLGMPVTLRSPPVEARQRVWTAIGYLAGTRDLTNPQALALLRAVAYTEDTDLETVADRVLAGDAFA